MDRSRRLDAIFSMDIILTGEAINMAHEIDKCITMKHSLQRRMADLFDRDYDLIVTMKPTRISN